MFISTSAGPVPENVSAEDVVCSFVDHVMDGGADVRGRNCGLVNAVALATKSQQAKSLDLRSMVEKISCNEKGEVFACSTTIQFRFCMKEPSPFLTSL
jgi:hypothetical protein